MERIEYWARRFTANSSCLQVMTKPETTDSPRLVRELMTIGVPTCPLNSEVTELASFMLGNDLEAVIVLDERGHAAGVVTRTELIQAYANDKYREQTAESIMRVEVPQVPPDIPLTAAAQIMQDLNVRVLYMMHHAGGIEYPAAMLTYTHLLRHVTMREAADLSDLGIYAERQSPLELFIERRDEARRQARLKK
jgi:CBS domain-containing protein